MGERQITVKRSRSWLAALVVIGLASFAMGVQEAHAIAFDLNRDGCTGGCGTGSTVFGTVNVVQGSDAQHVNVTVTLNSSYFVGTGAGEALEFNISGSPSITVTNLTSGYKVGSSPASASTFGSFGYSITCEGSQSGHCGPGASHKLPGPLSFTVALVSGSNLAPTAFIANSGGYYFASDIMGPSGKTGNVAASSLSPVPEPSSLLLLGFGLAGLGTTFRKRLFKG